MAGSNTYTSYDNNGSLLLGGGRSLTWDANNLVTQVVMGGSTTTFTYGPDGDRIKKTSSSTTLWYPFGDDYEINGSTVTKYFNAGFGVIAKKVGTTPGTGTVYWLHSDRLGSINATTDGSGAEVLRRSYRSYGELLGQTGTHTESLGYIGQRTDGETGLTYLHARYYDPVLGMFVSPDPIGADMNAYRYVGGNPTNFGDPSGLTRQEEGKGNTGDLCERFGWSCTAEEAGGGYGGMGGPGPGSSPSNADIGGLPGVITTPDGYAYPVADPVHASQNSSHGGWAYDPISGGKVYIPGGDPQQGIRVASLGVSDSGSDERIIESVIKVNGQYIKVRLSFDSGGLTGISVQLTGPASATYKDYTVQPNTFVGASLYGPGLEVATTNPLLVNGPGIFNGTVSYVRFNGAGDVIYNNATLNYGPDVIARMWVTASIGNQLPGMTKVRGILLAGRH